MTKYKAWRMPSIGKKPRWVVVDIYGDILNKYPTKEELKELKKLRDEGKYRLSVSFDEKNFFWIVVDNGRLIRNPTEEELIGTNVISYNLTNICHLCREESERDFIELTDKSILYPGRAYREKDKDRNVTGKSICKRHDSAYRQKLPNSQHNIFKSITNCRTRNQNPNSTQAKGDNSQKLACRLYGWKDLNEESDNYNSPLDCYDPKTGLYHQVQGRHYIVEHRKWPFGDFEDEWGKIFEDIVCFCFNENRMMIERIYKFPRKEIMERTSLGIYKYDIKENLYVGGWYEKYRVKDEDELERANNIWGEIVKERNKYVKY